MRKAVFPVPILILLSCLMVLSLPALAPAIRASSSTPPPSSKPPPRPYDAEKRKARQLYLLARAENPRLTWDECLSAKAFVRARQMVNKKYFDHRDPETGRNPAWEMVRRCVQCSCAAENLARGMGEARAVHIGLMESPSHRKNIVDPSYSLIGVGCYDYICVELFAGFDPLPVIPAGAPRYRTNPYSPPYLPR